MKRETMAKKEKSKWQLELTNTVLEILRVQFTKFLAIKRRQDEIVKLLRFVRRPSDNVVKRWTRSSRKEYLTS